MSFVNGLFMMIIGGLFFTWSMFGGLDKILLSIKSLIQDAYRYRMLKQMHLSNKHNLCINHKNVTNNTKLPNLKQVESEIDSMFKK